MSILAAIAVKYLLLNAGFHSRSCEVLYLLGYKTVTRIKQEAGNISSEPPVDICRNTLRHILQDGIIRNSVCSTLINQIIKLTLVVPSH